MTLREFLGNVGIIFAVMGVLALVEAAVPLFARGERSRGRARANLGLSALTLVLNWAMSALAAAVALRAELDGRGSLVQAVLPLPAAVAATVLTLDLCTYVAHRGMHSLPFLWRAHRVHHGDPFLDVTSTLRQHPLEGLWRFLWIIVPTWALGLPALGVVIYRLLSVLQGLLEHANLRVWRPLDRALSLAWVAPDMHKVHHSRAREETDSNYGNLLALFDRALGTFTPSERARDVVYGLDDVDSVTARSLRGLLALPFAAPGRIGWADEPRARGTAGLGRSE
jgi:sterol desaturase/sphingolipid hydroxylase (fatty acid hydroxylase superfamily)